MGKRLILFTIFLCLVGFFLTITNYRKYFNSEENLSQEQLHKIVKAHQDEQMAAAAGKTTKVATVKVVAMDLEDPIIKKGLEVYTTKGQCIECHGDNGQGNADKNAPVIAGQHDWYVIDQVQQMKAGTRINQEMNPYLEKINEDDIKAVAKYIKYLRVKE